MEDLLQILEHIGILIGHTILRLDDHPLILLQILTEINQEPTTEEIEILIEIAQALTAVDHDHQVAVLQGHQVARVQVLRQASRSQQALQEVVDPKEVIKNESKNNINSVVRINDSFSG